MAKPLRYPVLSRADQKRSDKFKANCGPISLTAVLGQPYKVIHDICESYGWTEEGGMQIADLMMIVEDFGYRTRYMKKESKKRHTLAWVKKNLLKSDRKYILGTDGHVLAWVNGEVVDSYDCFGQVRVHEIIEVK